WRSTPTIVHQWEMSLETADGSFRVLNDGVSFPNRGAINIEHLKVSSQMPFGLYRAWIYFPMKVRAYVYPEHFKGCPPFAGRQNQNEGDHSALFSGPHDLWNLAPYQGEESRKISWK